MFELGKKGDGSGESTGFPASESRQKPPSAAARSGARGEAAVIGRSIQINGDLRGDEDLLIEGDVSGTVELTNSNLKIGKEGRVRADVYAKAIAVDGTTEGDLFASERVTIHVNAQVRGNITAPRVGIEEGARFKGSIEMDQKAVEKALKKASAESAAPGTSNGRSGDLKSGPKKLDKEPGTSASPPAGAA